MNEITGNAFINDLQRHKDSNHKIVFTNGVYDIIHPGHIQLLAEAKTYGDILIVGINSDASVKMLDKAIPNDSEQPNIERPINKERDRATVLDAIQYVDYVVVYEESTPLRAIRQIMPDVLVKGKDWDDKDVVGRDVVEANGGEVIIVDLVRGHSTTELIERCWRAFSEG